MQNLKIIFGVKNFTTIVLLSVILLIAGCLRLYQLGSVPSSPDWDEAALGYSAYSIMQTGKDEYGKSFPVILQSFNDYKPALYVYLTIPSVAAFGLNTFAVRLPSAVFGILTVLATYFFVKELFNIQQATENKSRNYAKALALLSTFLLAISPWHIQFSRVAFEANIGLAFNVFAILFFLKGLKKPIFLSLSTASLGLGIYTYQSQKLFIPLLALCLVLVYWKNIFTLPKKYILSALAIGFIVALPMLTLIITDKQTLSRAKGVSILSAQNLYTRLEVNMYAADKEAGNYSASIFHNRFVKYGREITAGYLSHFDFIWLFLRGDQVRHHAPNMGLLYLWEFPFLLIGIYILLFGNFTKKTKMFIFLWFLMAPLPAAATTGVPHAVRTLNFLPTFQIFVAIGIVYMYQLCIKYKSLSVIKYNFLKLLIFLYLLFIIFNFSYYINQYFVQQNYFFSEFWQFGYKDAVKEVTKIQGNYKKIVISNEIPLDQSYIFFLFYTKYPPQKYQQENNLGQYTDVHKFANYEFRPINWAKEDKNNTLFVGRPLDFPDGGKIIKSINYLNGQEVIRIVED